MRFVLRLAFISLSFMLVACQSVQSGPTMYSPQLMKKVQDQGLVVVQQGNRICVIIPSIEFFNPQTAELLEGKGKVLLSVAALAKSYPNSPIRVIGFSDNISNPETQYYRAQNEAEIVAAFLWKGGVPLANTTTQILGSSTLGMVASDATPTGRNANDRVEVWIN